MDVFCEYLVKKKKKPADHIYGVLCLLAGLCLTALIFPIIFGRVFGFEVFIVAAIWYGVVFLVRKTNIEYEYILTNNMMDIDKIMSQKTRKRIITIDFKTIEEFGEKKNVQSAASGVKVLDLSEDINAEGVYYVDFFDKSQKTRVYFSPNENILKNLRNVNPKKIMGGMQ